MRIITTTSELETFAAALAERPFAAIDTEFIREKTYWPVLCLIQAAADDLEAIIDPLAEGIDLTPFLELLADKSVVKVFHAARQDVEIFYQLMNAVPEPLFDTQVAAMACGYGDQISYEALMRGVLNAKIDKGSRFTDWARRPLSDRQLSYALSDVTHLRDAYPTLRDQLESQARLSWVEEEMAALVEPSLYFIEPENAWKRLKTHALKTKEIGPFIKLAEWREAQAQMRDVPRNRILKDDALMELARAQPSTPKELGRARSVPSGFERSNAARGILEAIDAGQTIAREDLPQLTKADRKKPPAA
ncbi:MAG: ribonuclease D, partial [Pseudomonadota bacterium]